MVNPLIILTDDRISRSKRYKVSTPELRVIIVHSFHIIRTQLVNILFNDKFLFYVTNRRFDNIYV